MSANYTRQKPTYLINQKPKRAKPVNEQQKKKLEPKDSQTKQLNEV